MEHPKLTDRNIAYDKFAVLTEKYNYKNGFYQQHIADAVNAEFADEETNNTQLAFALAGLYLFIEHEYDGRQVQDAHAQLARSKTDTPIFSYEHDEPTINLKDIANRPNEQALRDWASAVWVSYASQHDIVRSWVDEIGS